MPGTKAGSIKAVATILSKNPDHFKEMGRKGGSISRGGGFAAGEAGRERARLAGSQGGKTSKRGASKLYEYKGKMLSAEQIAHKMGLSCGAVRRRIKLYGSIYGQKQA